MNNIRLLFICMLCTMSAKGQDSTYRLISMTPQTVFVYPGPIYVPSVYFEHSTSQHTSIVIGVQAYLADDMGLRITADYRKYFGDNPFRSWYLTPGIAFGVHDMTHLYERPREDTTQWVSLYDPLSFFFIPFAFADFLMDDEKEYQTDVQTRYAIGASIGGGYRYGFGEKQKWLIDVQAQAGFFTSLNSVEPQITLDDRTYTLTEDDSDNPYAWHRSFLGSPVRLILTVGYRF